MTHKQYRAESKNMQRLLERMCGIVEKCSIDEAFLDVSNEVELLSLALTSDPQPFTEDSWKVSSGRCHLI